MSRSAMLRAAGWALGIAVMAAPWFGEVPASAWPAAGPPAAVAPAIRDQQQLSSPAAPRAGHDRALLDRYCVTCHNEKLKTAGLMLDRLDLARVSDAADVWEKVVQKLGTGAMPPAGLPRPEKAAAAVFVSQLEAALDRAAAQNPNPGRPAIHRLNRTEYANAIRDLLALEIDAGALLPADNVSYGFDNIASGLSVSQGLLERYLSAAQKISRLAIGASLLRPVSAVYRVSPALWQHDRMSDDLPPGTRGGVAIRHDFPLDGEYVLKVRMERTYAGGPIRGLGQSNALEIRVDGERVKAFTIGGSARGMPRSSDQSADQVRRGRGRGYEEPRDEADAGLEVRFPAKAGSRLVGVTFLKSSVALEGLRPERYPVLSNSNASDRDGPMRVETVDITGPYDATGPGDTPTRRRIFVCRPTGSGDEEPCAKKILATLARRAYRRPVTDDDVQTLLGFYRTGRSEGGFESGIEWALEKILVAADFLFRIERDPAAATRGAVYRLSDLELASRLSFFLWSSIPDDELLDVAVRGQLKDPAILEKHVARMLADPRARALVDNFFGQWLYVRRVRSAAPDPKAFPEFDENLREAFQRETELFLDSQLREDRSVMDLFTADYTFVNERLARHYRIPNVYGSHFRRVTLTDEARKGLLGQGSILTVTAYAHRTSPVLRGKWVLDNILGEPPPPPPADVPNLKENDEGSAAPLSMRARLEQHRKNPACASCHARMDPLGFALENFDAVGKWRSAEGNTPIDASGVLPDGTTFSGAAELRDVLVSRRDQIVTTVIRKLLTYALGRGPEYYDEPSIRAIRRDAARSDDRWSALVLGIIKSTPFQMRRARES